MRAVIPDAFSRRCRAVLRDRLALIGQMGLSVRMARGATALVVGIALLVAGCAESGMNERTPVPQERTERVVAEGAFEIVDTLQANGPGFSPLLVTRLHDGDVLAYDAGSYQLLRYDSTGAIVARYGSGPGSGPGEHERVADIGEFESGEIWSFDQQQNVVNVFAVGGDFDRRIELEDIVHFMAAKRPDHLIGINPTVDDPFRIHDSEGRAVRKFGWLLDEPGMQSVPYVGRVMSLADGGFAYLMHTSDILKAYDADGDLVWHRMMIDGFEPPGIYREEGGSAYLEHPNGTSTITRTPLNASNDRIHAFVVNSSARLVFIDTYSARDGSYVGSRHVPVADTGCNPRYVAGNTALMICGGNTLVRARIPSL